MKKRIVLLVAAAALAIGACNGTDGASPIPSVPDLNSVAPELSPEMSPEMSLEPSPVESPAS
jgi:hypothetical protein